MELTKQYLEQLIADRVEESGQLEYKAARSLGRTNEIKKEITKDISSFANAAGGILVYGIRENDQPDLRHLPAGFDPIDQSQFSKEWLDQIASLIQPRIEGLRIVPVHVGPLPSDYCYISEIPQSGTAHQALDHRYYKRRNFESTAMEDYEIRDVMNRRKHPALIAEVRVVSETPGRDSRILVRVQNVSPIMAQHFAILVAFPLKISSGYISPEDATMELAKDGMRCWLFTFTNSPGSPLFPSSSVILRRKFEYIHGFDPDPGPSIPDIRLTLYADEMEKITLTKNLSRAEAGWV